MELDISTLRVTTDGKQYFVCDLHSLKYMELSLEEVLDFRDEVFNGHVSLEDAALSLFLHKAVYYE